MNNKRRERLGKAKGYLEEANSIVDAVRDEEEDALDNMPENLQSGDRYDQMEECVGCLSDIIHFIESTIDKIDEVVTL